ncbi:hybrid sensor histidine kinase/response regulator, partial [Acinetobacter baumannii]
MSNFNKTLSKRLRLNHAYGQLIALIFVPIMILTCVGAFLVLTETSRSAKQQQLHHASAILARYNQIAKDLYTLVELQPDEYDHAQHIMQSMFSEKNLKRAALIDSNGQTYLSIGYRDNRYWPNFTQNNNFFGPISYNHNNIYGVRIIDTAGKPPVWLLIEMDNQPLELARYRILIALVITGLMTLLLLLLCLNFYSRRWIAPMYEIRMQLQRLNADTL